MINKKLFFFRTNEIIENHARIDNEYSIAIQQWHGCLPIETLIGLEATLSTDDKKKLKVSLEELIAVRIKYINEIFRKLLAINEHLTQNNLKHWFTLSETKNIIKNLKVNQLAVFAKEMPNNHDNRAIIIEALHSRVNSDIINMKCYKSNENIRLNLECAIDATFSESNTILSNFDVNCDFFHYIHSIVKRKLVGYPTTKTKGFDDGIDKDDVIEKFNKIVNFITISYVLFEKVNEKPHMKLIFWTENTSFIKQSRDKKKTIRAVDHDAFYDKYKSHKLNEIFYEVVKEVDIIKALQQHKDLYGIIEDIDYLKEYTSYPDFHRKMKMPISKVYTEKQTYSTLIKQHGSILVGSALLKHFLCDGNGKVLQKENIKSILSNWNTRTKKSFREVFCQTKFCLS